MSPSISAIVSPVSNAPAALTAGRLQKAKTTPTMNRNVESSIGYYAIKEWW